MSRLTNSKLPTWWPTGDPTGLQGRSFLVGEPKEPNTPRRFFHSILLILEVCNAYWRLYDINKLERTVKDAVEEGKNQLCIMSKIKTFFLWSICLIPNLASRSPLENWQRSRPLLICFFTCNSKCFLSVYLVVHSWYASSATIFSGCLLIAPQKKLCDWIMKSMANWFKVAFTFF